MPKQSAFKHYELDQAKRKQLDIDKFGGVDYSTQQFLIADGRAIDIKNFIYKDGVIQKRNGYEEIYQVQPYKYLKVDFDTKEFEKTTINNVQYNKVFTNTTNFNGIWSFKAEDNKNHIIAHIGNLLFEITDILDDNKIEVSAITYSNQTSIGDDLLSYYGCYAFENYKSSAFVSGNKLWFLGGNKYMCLRFTSEGVSLFPVENSEITPIPTTTVSITYQNANTNNRMSLDRVNLLTMWRKNKLISGVGKNETEETQTVNYDYTLDSPLLVRSESDMVDFNIKIEERGEVENG